MYHGKVIYNPSEIWKDVVGYEGLYQISSFGNVKSLGKTIDKGKFGKVFFPEKLLSVFIDNQYFYIGLHKNKKQKKISIHRILAIAFIPNPENKPFINHKNGIKTDNRIENLEWVTPKENSEHASINNLVARNFGEKNGKHKLNTKDILLIRNSRYKISRKELSKNLNVSIKHIDRIRENKRWRHI